MGTVSRELHLARRPVGPPVDADFRMVETVLPDPLRDQLLVRNLAMSVDPYMRVRMAKLPSYPFWELDEVMQGSAIGEVVESRTASLPPGSLVVHRAGWREWALLDHVDVALIAPAADVPLTAHLGVLGMTGLTAYVGLTTIAQVAPGDTVFVSGAAGAVGSVAGQIARLLGAGTVIGSAGTTAKVRHVIDDLGFDAAFNYRDGNIVEQLRVHAPDGIDVYFDNVAGEHLEAAVEVMNAHGRIALCGAIAEYNALDDAPGPRNLILAVTKRLMLQGFTVREHLDQHPEFIRAAADWIRTGQLVSHETIVNGLDAAVGAFQDLLNGTNTGKMLVRLAQLP